MAEPFDSKGDRIAVHSDGKTAGFQLQCLPDLAAAERYAVDGDALYIAAVIANGILDHGDGSVEPQGIAQFFPRTLELCHIITVHLCIPG